MEKSVPLKIMIVDDDSDDLGFFQFLFNKNKNFEIISCLDSGEQALELLMKKEVNPDILLIDMHMPKITGLEIAENIFLNDSNKAMHIFIISTSINESHSEKYRNIQKIDFLQKPVTLEQINDLPGILLEKLNRENDTKI